VKEDAQQENVDLNLCALLGIDVEGIAYRLALGLDEDAESMGDAAEQGENPDIQKGNTGVSTSSSIHKSSNSNALAEALSASLSNRKED